MRALWQEMKLHLYWPRPRLCWEARWPYFHPPLPGLPCWDLRFKLLQEGLG